MAQIEVKVKLDLPPGRALSRPALSVPALMLVLPP